ncbi:hypothetical protein [Cohnella hashimotonis]|uniref:Glycosyl hydrolase n=1 Tax=Cohnella hashimotonis TaxID=2826895 RepID=A0ABT6TV07_9BACL|nr:hypothetical protein [Cohnella hashimotonis]MDI4650155.1 hypothetical protein [Cohnella hashimotonis]
MIIRLLAILGLCVAILSGCEKGATPTGNEAASPLPPHRYGASATYDEGRAALEAFIDSRLTGPDGIYTNLLETTQDGEAASGHEILSESAGLLMRYDALNGRRQSFAEAWSRAKALFDMDASFSYRYGPLADRRYPVNAAVDDLRIIRALYEAGAMFKDDAYKSEADRYGQRFYAYNVKDGRLYDFYDETYKTTNDFVTLCYIDLKTLGMLDIPDGDKKLLLENARQTAEDGYLGDAFPFYETRYDYGTGEYASPQDIRTVESLVTILHLSEAGLAHPESVAYIKKQVGAGTLFGTYNRSGEAKDDVRSTAIYALAAMIGSAAGDKELYEQAMARMNELRTTGTGGPLDGGFGDPATGQAYSFDNLTALLAYAY